MNTANEKLTLLPTDPALLTEPGRPYINRDISWLQFNGRVLQQARNVDNPALERLKFLAITSTNLDEFFMIRFSSILRKLRQSPRNNPMSNVSRLHVYQSVLNKTARFIEKQRIVLDNLRKQLENGGVIMPKKTANPSELFSLSQSIFINEIAPELGHLEVLSRNQLKRLDNLQIAVIFSDNHCLVIPKHLPEAYLAKDSQGRDVVFFLDELLKQHLLQSLGMNSAITMIRLTRDADLSIDIGQDDAATVPDNVRNKIRRRDNGRPLRLQISGFIDAALTERLEKIFRISSEQIFITRTTLNLKGILNIANQLQKMPSTKKLTYPPMKPHIPSSVASGSQIFKRLQESDILLHHPYDSFGAFVSWIESACKDSKVESIQLTIYRTDSKSRLMTAIKKAAKQKKVRVLIEVRARFDELNNLKLADELRSSGVEVKFGFGELKLHAKVALVTRKEDEQSVYYTHLSTGNYNSKTASLYEDIAILTAHQGIGDDVKHFLDSVWASKVPSNFKHLVSAPTKLHKRLISLIDREIKAHASLKNGHIVVKVNAMIDEKVTAKLYEASQAGVQVDLIVRGPCTLIPGIKQLSENIRVISLVDRYLEHSRLYMFKLSKNLYLSSADWMPRNFFSRLEIAFPVLDQQLYDFVENVIIPTYLNDTVRAKELRSDGKWRKRLKARSAAQKKAIGQLPNRPKEIRAQFYFEDLCKRNYRGTSLHRRQSNR